MFRIKKDRHIDLDDCFFADQLDRLEQLVKDNESITEWITEYDPHYIIHMLIRLEVECKYNNNKYMKNYLKILEYILQCKRSIRFRCRNTSCTVSFGHKLNINKFCSGCKECNIFKVFDILHPHYVIYHPTSLVLSCLTYSYFCNLRMASLDFKNILKKIIILLVQHGAKKTIITDKGEIEIVDLVDEKYNNLYE